MNGRIVLIATALFASGCGSSDGNAAAPTSTTTSASTTTIPSSTTYAPDPTSTDAATTTTTAKPRTGAVSSCNAGSVLVDDDHDGFGTCKAAPTTIPPTTTVPAVRVLRGVFTLKSDHGIEGTWTDCNGSGGYSDFGPGMNVTVRDGDNHIVGAGSTESLTEADLTSIHFGIAAIGAKIWENSDPIGECTVKLELEVKDAEFYSIKVGSRGELSYSKKELASRDYFLELSLGD